MKRFKIWLSIFLLSLGMLVVNQPVQANSAEPPCFTIIVNNPPEDLTISLIIGDQEIQPIQLDSDFKAWEGYYRFYYHALSGNKDYDILEKSSAVLSIQYDDIAYEVTLPSDSFSTYNNLLTLDVKSRTLTLGQPIYRVFLLVALRVAATLLIEGLIFWLLKYRKKKSWIIFLLTNLITQTTLNFILTSSGSYWMIGLVILEFLITIIEMLILSKSITEKEKFVTCQFAIFANLISLFIGGAMISFLPI